MTTKRIVVGFDIRKSSSLANVYMTSYDENTRYEDIYEELRTYQNGLNLFYVDPSDLIPPEVAADARIVAFDLPEDVVQSLLSGNVSTPKPLPKADLKNGWGFIGFDVVDPITQTSAFHGFTPSIPVVLIDCIVSFNDYGLLEDFETALKVANYYSDHISEHAPFSPCGVWLKQACNLEGRREIP